ncbi:anti-sigma factor [Dyadobacter flavalbus]|uniref:Anti-sigma factor n=1 Tax=Dyadobacter flavalbus TaxID=2579942 RepID=A0A5M8R0X3_9BACT|nr:anti-sigma factor [Dyadobacter flavalbus]KAA6440606.1 anti-sigma factor [Dyadobacter flavalbus]
MNIQAYIESGILEEYVLGTVSPQEKQEVECMSHIYPEIKEELLRTESALEEYALKHQTAPPASLKESIFAKMDFDTPQNTAETNADESHADSVNASENVPVLPVSEKTEDSNVITNAFDRTEVREVTPLWARLAVAASLLLALFAAWSANEINGLKKSNEKVVAEMESIKSQYVDNQQLTNLYRNPKYKIVQMAGLPKSPESSVAAFWNQQTNEVLLDVRKLPEPPQGKQYQLWSIVDGKPVDIGMLDNQFSGKVLKMKNTKPGSAAFAITLEKEGGNPTPTMEEMYVMGKAV